MTRRLPQAAGGRRGGRGSSRRSWRETGPFSLDDLAGRVYFEHIEQLRLLLDLTIGAQLLEQVLQSSFELLADEDLANGARFLFDRAVHGRHAAPAPDHCERSPLRHGVAHDFAVLDAACRGKQRRIGPHARSEEHTSELQSLAYL